MTVLVLLGAGASYGCEGSTFGELGQNEDCPPLGNRLFDELDARGGIASTVNDEMKGVFRKNFELGMQSFYEMHDGDIMQFQREMAHYLAGFRPTESCLYNNLIEALGNKRVIYSSLNYDLLLECSAFMQGLSVVYSKDFHSDAIRVIKPHGSSNFWPNLAGGKIEGSSFGGGRADIEAPIQIIGRLDTVRKCVNEDSLSPAIAMFAEGKKVKVCPDFVDAQKDIWIELAEKSSKVFIIGVRVHEVDQHIWGTLGKSKAEIHYYGLKWDRGEFDTWKSNYSKKNAYFHESDFAGSVDDIKSRVFPK